MSASADGIASAERFERPGFVRLTASDRPGVAQPVPERDIPPQPWGRILLGALVLFLLLMGAWEWKWRAFGATPGYRNSDGAWAEQRRRIDSGEGGGTVLIGDSRMLFDVQLAQWEAATGDRPIQLALEGTSAVPVLEDLAQDPAFTGRLLVGVAPDLFFSGFAYRGSAIGHFHKQGPSQRSGHWLSKRLLEPYFAFYDPDFALPVVVRRQPWPLRPGMQPHTRVRKLMEQESDRNTRIWSKVENDPEYRALARSIWAQNFTGPPPPPMATPERARQTVQAQIDRAAKAVASLRARGVRIVFVRPPSNGPYYAFEQKAMPRKDTWDVLLQRTGLPGIHFDDYPQMRGYTLPEWSHLSAADAQRYTLVLAPMVEREFQRQERELASADAAMRR
ncbi:hypothetical protein [Lysobacter niastensis]|uniref:Uncharacterized protein n=1 Tax=Lysobacter niastensis TaxID=380629 RepID=A0ABS0B7T6_9GAMM|nr:hypothetical protein [Lysobacter niastensis]MBF6025089.1 hypothetical protein [Lysobacter niastensis]